MAINETWVTGKKYRVMAEPASKKWNIFSFLSKAQDTIFDDGKNAQQKLGNINGITDDPNVDDSNIAVSSKALNTLNKTIEDRFMYEGTAFYLDKQGDKWGWNEKAERGADTFHPFNITKTEPFSLQGTNGGSRTGSYKLTGTAPGKIIAVQINFVNYDYYSWENGPMYQRVGLSITDDQYEITISANRAEEQYNGITGTITVSGIVVYE